MPKHPDNDNFLSVHIPFQVPDFVGEDHEAFIVFIQAYFRYLELLGSPAEVITNLDSYVDIDKTTDEFITLFRECYLHDIPEKTLAEKEFLVKKIREFYRARGTEKSFQFLFRVLFNEEVSVSIPKEDILKPSDGDWRIDQILKAEAFDNIPSFFGKQITGTESGATAIVEIITLISENKFDVAEIAVSNIVGEFFINETVTALDDNNKIISFKLDGMLSRVVVDKSGSLYSPGDEIIISGGGGRQGEGRLLKEDTTGIIIKEDGTDIVAEEDFGVNMRAVVDWVCGGTIDGTKINNGGTKYKIGDKLELKNNITTPSGPESVLLEDGRPGSLLVNDVSGTLKSIRLINGGSNYLNPPSILFLGGDSTLNEEGGLLLSENGIDFIVGEDSEVFPAKAQATITGGPITSVTVQTPGQNYQVGDIVKFLGSGSGASAEVTTVNGTGGIVSVTVTNQGDNYITPPEIEIESGIFEVMLEDGSNVILDFATLDPYTTGVNDKLLLSDSFGTGAILSPNGWGKLSNIYFPEELLDNRGRNYLSKPTIKIIPVDGSGSGAVAEVNITKLGKGEILEVQIENEGFNYIKIPPVDATGVGDGNANIEVTTESISGIKSVLISKPGFNATKAPLLDASKIGDGKAKLTSFASALFRSGRGFHVGTKSFISHDKYLQDNDFYQTYSYVVNHGGKTANFWRDVVNRILHPAGFNLFSQIDILSEVEVSLSTMSIRGPSGKPDFHNLPGEPVGPGEDATIILRLVFNIGNKFDLTISRNLPSSDVPRLEEFVFVPGSQSDNLITGENLSFQNGVIAKVADITPRGTYVQDVFLPQKSNLIFEFGNSFLDDNGDELVLENSVIQIDSVKEVEGLEFVASQSNTTGKILRSETERQYTQTKKSILGSTWKSLDYQKFFSNGGYSNLSEEDTNIILEDRVGSQFPERLRMDGNTLNGNDKNLIFDPVNLTFSLAGRYLLEDGNYILSEINVDRPTGDILTFEDIRIVFEDCTDLLSESSQEPVLDFMVGEDMSFIYEDATECDNSPVDILNETNTNEVLNKTILEDEYIVNEDGSKTLDESNNNPILNKTILEDEPIVNEDGSKTIFESNVDPVSDFNITEDEIITNENGDTIIAENGDRFVTQSSNSRISYEDGNRQLNQTSILGTQDGIVEENNCLLVETGECVLDESSDTGGKISTIQESVAIVYEDGSCMQLSETSILSEEDTIKMEDDVFTYEDGTYILNETSFLGTKEYFVLDNDNAPLLNFQSFGGTYRINHFKDIYLNSIINPSDGSIKSNYRERRTSESYINIIKPVEPILEC